MLIPHVVRKAELDEAANREISVGTASSIQLSRLTPLTPPAAQMRVVFRSRGRSDGSSAGCGSAAGARAEYA